MNELTIPYIKEITVAEKELSALFDQLPNHSINQLSWEKEFPYQPKVHFNIAYSADAILLKFQVEEKHLRINSFQSNDPVFQDSCVEFFISFQEGLYYNLEFNSVGVAIVGYGPGDKSKRNRLSKNQIAKIKSFSNITTSLEKEGVQWSLSLYIPFELFNQEKLPTLRGTKCRANFYKCGDFLPQPHYLSWNRIDAPKPNFHLPEFFGSIKFE